MSAAGRFLELRPANVYWSGKCHLVALVRFMRTWLSHSVKLIDADKLFSLSFLFASLISLYTRWFVSQSVNVCCWRQLESSRSDINEWWWRWEKRKSSLSMMLHTRYEYEKKSVYPSTHLLSRLDWIRDGERMCRLSEWMMAHFLQQFQDLRTVIWLNCLFLKASAWHKFSLCFFSPSCFWLDIYFSVCVCVCECYDRDGVFGRMKDLCVISWCEGI